MRRLFISFGLVMLLALPAQAARIFGHSNFNKTVSSAVGAVAFTGAGLDDATSAGSYSGASVAVFTVEIDANGTPDTFKWNKDGGSDTTGVAITGAAQAVSESVTIEFAATTGHTIGDLWTITTTVNGALSATALEVTSFCVQPLAANTGNVYLGDSSVDSTNGYIVDAPFCVSLDDAPGTFNPYQDRFDLSDWYFDVDTDAEGVRVIYTTFN